MTKTLIIALLAKKKKVESNVLLYSFCGLILLVKPFCTRFLSAIGRNVYRVYSEHD